MVFTNRAAARAAKEEAELKKIVQEGMVIAAVELGASDVDLARVQCGGHVLALARGVDQPVVPDAVEGQVVFGVSGVGIVEVDVARAGVRIVPVVVSAAEVLRRRHVQHLTQERREGDDRVLVKLSRPDRLDGKLPRVELATA